MFTYANSPVKKRILLHLGKKLSFILIHSDFLWSKKLLKHWKCTSIFIKLTIPPLVWKSV